MAQIEEVLALPPWSDLLHPAPQRGGPARGRVWLTWGSTAAPPAPDFKTLAFCGEVNRGPGLCDQGTIHFSSLFAPLAFHHVCVKTKAIVYLKGLFA